MTKKIIAFSGTHGTGKTTLAYNITNRLRKKGINSIVLDEFARECPLDINQCAGKATQYWILSSQVQRELSILDKYKYLISDRAIMDSVGYGISLKIIPDSFVNFAVDYIKEYYKKIFLLNPKKFNYHIDDGIRDMNPAFREKVHVTLLKLYSDNNIDFELINHESNAIKYINTL